MSKTYRYYGTVESRGRNYRQLPNPKPKANLGEGRSAKNLEQQLADAGVKTQKNQNIPWYEDAWGRQLHAQEAVKNKNFDAFKEFSDEQIRQMYPDDAQLANYIINGKNGTFMRDVKSLNEDAVAYEKKYGKVSDADVDSIIDAAIQKRDKKSLEDMGILTNDAIERWIDRHPSNSGFGKTGNILKSWRDEPAKYVIEPEATDANNASKPAETKADQSAANPEKVVPEKQAAQDMVNKVRPENENKQLWFNQPWRDIVNNTRDRNTPSPIPPNRLTGDAYPIVRPNPLDLSFNEKVYRPWAEEYGKRARPNDMDWILDPTEFWATRDNYPNPQPLVKYNPFLAALRSNGKLTGLSYAGLTGLALLAPYLKRDNINEQPQTQAPYRMETEPVSVSVPQAEPTPEQQFVLQSTSPFDYAKATNLFDLYDRYGSPTSPDNSVNNEELIDEVMSEFVSPQEPPALGTKIQNSGVASPDADEIPEEINDAMLDAKPGSFWKATRDVVSPKVNAVKNAAQNVFGRTLARSKTAPKTSNGSASNIQDTSNGPVVLNTPRQRKTNSRVNYQDAAKQMLGASEAVNNLAREAYNFNKQQSGQKPETALAQSLLRAQQESRANRGDTGLQQYRYQSLLNSGLRGMTPDEAIRSGLLTPEQVQVLMRGPY